MVAIGYARISKAEKKSVSIEYQVAEIKKLAMVQGYRLTNIEIDDGISGKSIKSRPAVQRVLEAVNQKKIDSVIVYRSDRMSRDGLEGLHIEKLFTDRGVKYLSCTEGLLAGGSVDDIFMGFIRNGLNQRERHIISLRTRQALQLKKSKGERLGSQSRYGYKVENRLLIQVPEEQELINRVKKLKQLGLSSYKITDVINSEGYTTRKNTQFTRTQIVRILKSPETIR